ncbi:MAG: translation initiation factor IF-2, partial [Clostridium sp.]|nr:translation initiation factor IF-2 [Clostridium sp.]
MDKDAPARPNQHQQSSRNQGGRGGIAGDTAARPKPARTPEKSSGYVRSYDNDGKAKSKKTIMKETAPSVRGWDDDGQSYGGRKRKTKQQEQPQRKPEPVVIEKAIITTETITVRDFSEKIGKPATEIIKKLFMMGIAANINQDIDFDTCELVAMDYNIELEHQVAKTAEEAMQESADEADAEENLIERPPVVTIMGHVDHGKTSLLDAIRDSAITEGEAGGITQHIGAYTVNCNGRTITFIDTPGHAAFTSMRARGAQVTDVVILVVAADDGIMPQTVEAINHAKAANVQIIVAINKIDKEGANPDRVKQELTEHGLVIEEWGGDVICVPVSAKTGEGIDELLENVLLVAEVQELRANPNRLAKGTVIEARLDKGRGPVATLLVQNGTLKTGDIIIAGTAVGRVRVMTNDKGKIVKAAGPSYPVEITGLAEVPAAGDTFNAVEDERLARELVEQRKHEAKQEQFSQYQKVTLDNLFSQIEQGEIKELPIIVKADVQGSVEAVKQSLEKLSNDEVRVKVIHGAVGAVSEGDVMLANASNAIIVGFNVRPDPVAADSAEKDGVEIRLYRIIYDAIEEVSTAMKGMLAPKFRENLLGRCEVRQVYKISNVGNVAGVYVLDGK